MTSYHIPIIVTILSLLKQSKKLENEENISVSTDSKLPIV